MLHILKYQWFLHEFETNRKSQIIIIIISCPGWCLQPGQNSLAPLSPSLSPRSSHSAHLFLLFLARERGVLVYLLTTFVKIFYSPVHPSALKVCGLFLSSFIACVAHFILQKQRKYVAHFLHIQIAYVGVIYLFQLIQRSVVYLFQLIQSVDVILLV